jgi:starch phosphorylase
LISDTIGSVDEWISSLENLRQLSAYKNNPEFIAKFAAVKRQNKVRLAEWVK